MISSVMMYKRCNSLHVSIITIINYTTLNFNSFCFCFKNPRQWWHGIMQNVSRNMKKLQ